MKNIRVTFANAEDEGAIKRLLAEVDLPHEDLSNHLHNFLLAKSNDTLIGVVGLEVLGDFGLLRSLAVASLYRGRGIGKMLYEKILAHANLQGIRQLYLLTTTAEGFFSMLGFSRIEQNKCPKLIHITEEFQNLCPSNAVCMVKRIDKTQY